MAGAAIGVLGDSELTIEDYKGKAAVVFLADGIQESLPVYREVTQRFPEDFGAWYKRLIIEAYLGNKEGYSECIQQMVALDSTDPPQKRGILKASMLIPEGYVLTRTHIESVYKHWNKVAEKNWNPSMHFRVGLAFVDYRAGRYQNAIDHITRMTRIKNAKDHFFSRDGGMGLGLLIKAMSEFQMRNETAAKQTLAEAQKNMSHRFPEGSKSEPLFPDRNKHGVIYSIVLKEAEALILGAKFPKP